MATKEQTLHIYTRVSTVAQADQGTSLDTQRALGIKKAEDLGFEYKVWDEGGASSHHDDIAARPVLNQLFIEIKAGQIKHLWIYDQSRLSRNDQVASIFRYQCDKQGVTLYTKDGVFDLSNPSDKLMKQLLDAVAEFDNATRAERTRIGKLSRVRQGLWHGGQAVYGYRLENRHLVVDEEEAKWVKRIFQEVVKGSSAADIKKLLDSNMVLTRRQQGLWSIGSINALLTNPHYAGSYTYQDKKSGQTLQVQCPSIVDEITWAATQHKRTAGVLRQSQKNATVRHFYLLRDFMFCGHCQRPLSGRVTVARGEASYYCADKEREWVKKGESQTPWKRGTGCGFARAMNIKQADKLVWDTVKSLHEDSSTLKEEVKRRVLKAAGVSIRTDEEIKAIGAKIRRLQKEHQRLSESLGALEGNRLVQGFNDATFGAATARIMEAIGKTEAAIASYRLDLQGAAQSKKWVDWLRSFGDEMSGLDQLSDEKKKDYLAGLIERIDVRFNANDRSHEMTLTLVKPIVNDGIKYAGMNNGVREYEVVPGSSTMTVVAKKKDGRG